MERHFSRQQLYELVWSQPMRTIAATMGITDVALAKTCRKANIPVPPRGYWARKQAGRTVAKPPLPLRFPGASDMVGSERQSYVRDQNWREQILAEPIPPVPVFEEDLPALAKRARAISGTVEVPTTFQNRHTLIAKLLEQDEARRVEYAKYESSYYAPKYDSGIGRRKLQILNALFLHFQKLGCGISMTTSQYASDSRDIHIRVGQQSISLKLEPKTEQQKGAGAKPGSEKLRLAFHSSNTKEGESHWEDAGGSILEKRLTDIAVAILVAAETRYREAAFQIREWRIERKAEIEKELIEIRAEEVRKTHEAQEAERRKRIQALIDQAAQLERSNQIREYVRTVRMMEGLPVSVEQFARWGEWALSEADRMDPSKNGMIASAIASA